MPFLFIPLSAVSYIGMPANKNNEASAIFNLMRNLGGSVGVSFVATMLTERTQLHHARLAEHITPYSRHAFDVPLVRLNAMLQVQAATISYLEVFWCLGLLALAFAPFILLLPRVPKGAPMGH
jgi:DHA2 family multidrug resistance protein